MPAPAAVTRRALSGLSQVVGTSTIGTPASAAARTVDLPPSVTSAEQRGSSTSWLSQRATCTFAGNGAPPSTPLSRCSPVVRITSTGSFASASIAMRNRNGSPYASVLSVTCTHGRRVGIPSSCSSPSSPCGYQTK